jgi:hypothetical protein
LEVAKDHSAAAANVDNSQLEEKLAGASAKLSEQNEQLRALQQALKKAKDVRRIISHITCL